MNRLPPFRIAGCSAVLTGAASGIGAALAKHLAEQGARLILVDRDETGLAQVASGLSTPSGHRAEVVIADLSDPDAVQTMIDTVRSEHPQLDLVINNAGVAMAGRFDEVSAAEFDWLLQIDLLSPIMITRGLLPSLLSRPGSHLVNVSSVFGLHGPFGQAAYATAKFGLRGFSQSVSAELRDNGVGLTCVFPGGIATRIATSARIPAALDAQAVEQQKRDFDRLLRYPPDRAADKIIRAVVRRRDELLIGPDALLYSVGSRISPSLLAAVMRRGARSATDRS